MSEIRDVLMAALKQARDALKPFCMDDLHGPPDYIVETRLPSSAFANAQLASLSLNVAIAAVISAGWRPNNDVNEGSSEVSHPTHYGGEADQYETIKVLRAWLTPEEYIGFCKGNAIKYLSRHRKKGGNVDLEKGGWYIEELLRFCREARGN